MPRANPAPPPEIPGLAARRVAADVIDGVLRRKLSLDEQLTGRGANPGFISLPDRDRALARRLIATVLRRLGTLRKLLEGFLERGFPNEAPRVETILAIGAAQILWLDVPDHAAVDLAVRLAQADRRAARYVGLVNAVLRRVTREGPERIAKLDSVVLDTPAWLLKRWSANYGRAVAREIARANGQEPALDVSVKADAEHWATRLQGRVLPTGTVRTLTHGAVPLLPGFSDGAWWVQDAAAALPATLFGDVRGKTIADLCAAPGGKTSQLANAGAQVVAIDRSAPRLARLTDNLNRLQLSARTIAKDAIELSVEDAGGPFDGVLLDAPCSSTGTIRRHPDVPLLKSDADIASLVSLQQRLLDRAVDFVKPGGLLVYCVCSLEPDEGEQQIAALLERNSHVTRQPITPEEVGGHGELITKQGELRTLPSHFPDAEPRWGGLDGFFCARLRRLP
jgi:16S rRNA (cytosine967-C5)-methyltransferase